MCAAFGGLCPTGELSRRLRQCILTLRRCFLSGSACQRMATVAHKKNRVFVRITAIRRGVAISKHHSAPGERMLDVAGMASPAGRGRCCLPREAARPSAGGDAPVPALPQLELPLSQTRRYAELGPELGQQPGYLTASAASIHGAPVFIQYLGILFKIISALSQ